MTTRRSASATPSPTAAGSVAGSATLDITPVNDAPTTSAGDAGADRRGQRRSPDHTGGAAGQCRRRRWPQPDSDRPDDQQRHWLADRQRRRHLELHPGRSTTTPRSASATRITDGSVTVAGSATLDITPVNDAPTTSAGDAGADRRGQRRAPDHAGRVAGQCRRRRRPRSDGDRPGDRRGAASLVDNGDGTWTYTPALNDDTSVSFSYTITDGTASVWPAAQPRHHPGQRRADHQRR